MATAKRALIVVFDGLRPDMVTPELMPNLHGFARDHVHFTHSRSVFPSETRVNQASLVTGCWPGRHGISGNKLADPRAAGGRLLDTGNDDDLLLLDGARDGALLDAPSLGQHLRAAGRRLAVVGSGTAGGTRLLHHDAHRHGECRFSLYRPDRSSPSALVERVLGRHGEVPPVEVPCVERITYATDVYLDTVEPELAPDVGILWFFEPDYVYHYRGVGTPESLAAVSHADAQFGRVLAWWHSGPRAAGMQLLTLSDHGHVSIDGEPVPLLDALAQAGFRAGPAPGDGIDVLAFCSRVGGLSALVDPATQVPALVEWLRAQPWCGVVATRDQPGTVPLATLLLDHPGTPDIVFTLAANDSLSALGFPGTGFSAASGLAAGAGNHGGLNAQEMHNWFAAGGSGFGEGRECSTPCGIVDVLPTLMHTIGLPIPASTQGRVLGEALRSSPQGPAEVRRRTMNTDHESVHFLHVGAHRYINCARQDSARG